MIVKLFKWVTRAACCHVVCGAVGMAAVSTGYMFKTPEDGQADLSLQAANSLRDGVDRVIASESPSITLWGESNHCNVEEEKFLSDIRTLRMLAKRNLKQIFIEESPSEQEQIDAVAAGKKDRFEMAASSTCGYATGEKQDAMTSLLIKNAASLGIKIYAGDINYTWLTDGYFFNFLAMKVEAQPIYLLSKKMGDAWVGFGMRLFANNRVDETSVGKFILDNSLSGLSLVDRGNAHVLSDLPYSLRTVLPHTLSLSFLSQGWSMESDIMKSMCDSGEKKTNDDGLPVRPPNYLLDSDKGVVQKCAVH